MARKEQAQREKAEQAQACKAFDEKAERILKWIFLLPCNLLKLAYTGCFRRIGHWD
jgi:hypothetical protein